MCVTKTLSIVFAIVTFVGFVMTIVACATPGWAVAEVEVSNSTATVNKGLFGKKESVICLLKKSYVQI